MAADKVIVFITGANTGLGLETVKALCQSPKSYLILLGGRSLHKAEQAAETTREQLPSSASTMEAVQIDIESDDSIEKAFATVASRYGRVDTLINNAGLLLDAEIVAGTMTMRQAWNQTWNVNVTGTQILTHTFVPLLLRSTDPRLIFITSGASTLLEHEQCLNKRIDGPPPAGWPKSGTGGVLTVSSYRSAKTGMNMMMRQWARTLEEDHVKVWCVNPGFLATGLMGSPEQLKAAGALDPAIGGHFIKDVVEGKRDADVGKVIRKDNVQPW